jgi:hypothetical protein
MIDVDSVIKKPSCTIAGIVPSRFIRRNSGEKMLALAHTDIMVGEGDLLFRPSSGLPVSALGSQV